RAPLAGCIRRHRPQRSRQAFVRRPDLLPPLLPKTPAPSPTRFDTSNITAIPALFDIGESRRQTRPGKTIDDDQYRRLCARYSLLAGLQTDARSGMAGPCDARGRDRASCATERFHLV